MIYLTVRLAGNSATAANGISDKGQCDQFWLHASAEDDEGEYMRMPDDALDDSRVQWFRSPRVSYVLRKP